MRRGTGALSGGPDNETVGETKHRNAMGGAIPQSGIVQGAGAAPLASPRLRIRRWVMPGKPKMTAGDPV
jgi:hypothetical protein